MQNYMPQKLKITTLILLVLCIKIQAQQSVNSAGGNASSSSGDVSFSVGQITYSLQTGNNGNIAQGVQQPYEISVITALNNTDGIQMSAYPNPTQSSFVLYVDMKIKGNYQYLLFDINGKQLDNKFIQNEHTIVTLDHLPMATYMISVSKDKASLKTFKIIKK